MNCSAHTFRIFLSEASFLGRTFFFWPSGMTCSCILSTDLPVPFLGRYLYVSSWGVTEWGVSALDTPLFSSTIRFCFRQFAGGHWCFYLHLSRPALSYLVLLCLVFSRRACDDRSLMPVFGSGIIFFGQFDSARLGLAWVGSARHILARLVLARRRAFSFACVLFDVFAAFVCSNLGSPPFPITWKPCILQ